MKFFGRQHQAAQCITENGIVAVKKNRNLTKKILINIRKFEHKENNNIENVSLKAFVEN